MSDPGLPVTFTRPRPGPVQVRFRSGSGPDQVRIRSGSGPDQVRPGSDLVPTRFRPGFDPVSTRFRPEPRQETRRCGPGLDPIRTRFRPDSDPVSTRFGPGHTRQTTLQNGERRPNTHPGVFDKRGRRPQAPQSRPKQRLGRKEAPRHRQSLTEVSLVRFQSPSALWVSQPCATPEKNIGQAGKTDREGE